eukprot:409233-Prymnesium_polylepis.1
MPRDEKSESEPSSSTPPTASTSGMSAGFMSVPQSGPELPIPDTTRILAAAASSTLSMKGWSAESGPPMDRLTMCTRRCIAWLKASRNHDVYETCFELNTL